MLNGDHERYGPFHVSGEFANIKQAGKKAIEEMQKETQRIQRSSLILLQ